MQGWRPHNRFFHSSKLPHGFRGEPRRPLIPLASVSTLTLRSGCNGQRPLNALPRPVLPNTIPRPYRETSRKLAAWRKSADSRLLERALSWSEAETHTQPLMLVTHGMQWCGMREDFKQAQGGCCKMKTHQYVVFREVDRGTAQSGRSSSFNRATSSTGLPFSKAGLNRMLFRTDSR